MESPSSPVHSAPVAGFTADVPADRGWRIGVSSEGGRGWLPWAGLVLVSLLAHGLCLGAEFFLDDFVHLVESPWVTQGAWWSSGYRRVSYFFFMLIYRVWGASPVAFHAWNLMLHTAVTLTLFGVGRRILATGLGLASRRQAAVAAWCGAAVFGCHPLLSEGVNYAQNASLQLVTLLTLTAVGCAGRFVRERRLAWLGAAGALIWLAGYAKEVGFVFAGGSVFLTLVLDRRRGWWHTIRGTLTRRRTAAWSAGLVLAVGLLWLTLWWTRFLIAHASTTALWTENLFTQGRLFWAYAIRLVWPAHLCADHQVPLSGVGWQDPESLVKTLAVGLLMGAGAVGLVFRRSRLVCTLLLMGLLPLVLRLAYASKEYFVEYRAYPALPWLALLAGWGVQRAGHRRPVLVGAGMAVVLVTGITLSAQRSMLWGDPHALAEDSVRQYPANIRARTQLQKLDLDNGEYARVIQRAAESRRALAWVEAFNAKAPHGRRYELSMAIRGAMCSERLYTLALVETEGSQAALIHASEILARVRESFPSFVDPASTNYEIGAPMVEVQEILLKIGPAYDRLRANPQDREALLQIHLAREQRDRAVRGKGPLRVL